MRKLALPFGAVVLTAALAAACSAPATATATARTNAPGSAAVHGTTNIMLYSINSDGPDFRAVVSGVIGDYGPAVTVYPDGKVDPDHNSEMELNLAHGSFRLSIEQLDKKFVEAAGREPVYPRTCSDHFDFSVEVPIVPGSGTGAYQGLTGHFSVTVTADEVAVKPCSAQSQFLWQVIVVAGQGSVSALPRQAI
jgi:hypothetical protein